MKLPAALEGRGLQALIVLAAIAAGYLVWRRNTGGTKGEDLADTVSGGAGSGAGFDGLFSGLFGSGQSAATAPAPAAVVADHSPAPAPAAPAVAPIVASEGSGGADGY